MIIISIKTIAYKYGVILPYKTLSVWNGIGGGHMSDWIGLRPRQQVDRADRRQQHHKHRKIRQRHQRRSGDRAARAQHPLAVALTQQARSTISAFDRYIVAAEDLGKFDMEKLLQFRHAHFRNCHVAPPALASRRLLH